MIQIRNEFFRRMDFNTVKSSLMHIDINSCFATVEQQANPSLRYRPIAVAAYNSPGGCILAPSIEAKTYGIKTGMRVRDARLLYPKLIVLMPDPTKYRFIHLQLRKLLKNYCQSVVAKSIDEFVLDFENYDLLYSDLFAVAREIKQGIKLKIGDYIRVSIGLGPNRFLAKMAASYKKPDGLTEINYQNYQSIYRTLKLTDLHGINVRNELRLKRADINSITEFYSSPLWKIKIAFPSINAYYWYLRLRGYEIDDFKSQRRTFGNSFALPKSEGTSEELLPILQKLCEKTGSRMRASGYKAKGVHLSLYFKNRVYWHEGDTLQRQIFDSRDIYKEAVRLLGRCPQILPVHTIAVSCFNLSQEKILQFDLFTDLERKERLVKAIDFINDSFGNFVISPARMVLTGDQIKDRIAFGGVREL